MLVVIAVDGFRFQSPCLTAAYLVQRYADGIRMQWQKHLEHNRTSTQLPSLCPDSPKGTAFRSAFLNDLA